MELNGDSLAAQRRYARWLLWGTRLGLGVLVLGFIAYASGIIDAHVPIEMLPELWGRPAAHLLAQTGVTEGLGWAVNIHRGDMLVLAAIALLASCSVACLAAVMPIFHRRGEQAFAILCLAQIGVLIFAASGVLT